MTYSYSTMFRIGATHPAWILEWMLAVPWAATWGSGQSGRQHVA